MPCGLICKDESIGSDMIEIPQILQKRCVPMETTELENREKKEEILEKIFVGGGQLTEERG